MMSYTCFSFSAVSGTGFKFGIAHTVVKPPRAAERVPASIVSLYVNPGSLKWTWTSTKPGVINCPFASNTSSNSASENPVPIALIRPSSIQISAGVVIFFRVLI